MSIDSSARKAVLVTGATGLIGLEVVRTLVARAVPVVAFARGLSPGTRELVERERAGELRFVRGDLTQKDLGLSPKTLDSLARTVTQVVHAGAIYSFSDDPDRILETNVGGLEHLLSHLSSWEIRAFHHVSSVLAAGVREGRVEETLLDRAPSYRNAYEESKWISEQRVSAAFHDRLRVYRPGSVVGHSITGATTKFDGTYMAFGLLRRSPLLLIPGRGTTPFPIVTVDLVADVIAAGIASPPDGIDVIHVLDLGAPTLTEMLRSLSRQLAGHERALHIPEWMFAGAARLPGFERLTGIEPVGVSYMTSSADYRSDRFALFCDRHGIEACRIEHAYGPLVEFYLQAQRAGTIETRSPAYDAGGERERPGAGAKLT